MEGICIKQGLEVTCMALEKHLDSDAIIRSLRIALETTHSPDYIDQSMQRIRGMLSHFPGGSL